MCCDQLLATEFRLLDIDSGRSPCWEREWLMSEKKELLPPAAAGLTPATRSTVPNVAVAAARPTRRGRMEDEERRDIASTSGGGQGARRGMKSRTRLAAFDVGGLANC